MLPRLLANGRAAMLLGLCGIGLASAVAGIGIAQAVAGLFSSVLSAAQTTSPAGGAHWWLLPAAGLLMFLLQVAERALSERLGQHYVVELREAVFDHLFALADSERARLRNGHLMTRFTTDLSAMHTWVARGLAAALTGSTMLIGLILFLALHGTGYALAIAGLVGLLVAIVAAIGPGLGQRIREARRRRARLSAFMGERVTTMDAVRALGLGERDRARLDALARRLAQAMVVREGWSESVRALPTAGGLLAPALCLGAAALWPQGTPDAAELILVMTVAGLTTRPLTQLCQAFVQRSNFRVARQMLESLFRLDRQATRRTNGHQLRKRAFSVRIQRLRTTRDSAPCNWQAGAGARVVVRGSPGSGKTRLLRMLAGFERIDAGSIRFDRSDVTTLARESLHARVHLLSPDLPLLRGTLYQNVGIGRRRHGELLALLYDCGIVPSMIAADKVAEFRIGENGRDVGDSLTQRLLLARALASRPGLLLVDNLDRFRDPVFRERFETLWRTAPDVSIIVAGATKTFRSTADQVWTLDRPLPDGTSATVAVPTDEAANDAA